MTMAIVAAPVAPRDLKSSNFLIHGDGRVVVADLGHATDNQPDFKEPAVGTFKVRGYYSS
jgi:serine/threonine protein kinase